MKKKKRHILPPEARRGLDQDACSALVSKEIFSLLSLNPEFPVDCPIVLNRELILDILDCERHLTAVEILSYLLSKKGKVDWNSVNEYSEDPPDIIDGALTKLEQAFGASRPRLSQELIIVIHRAVEREYMEQFQPVEYDGAPTTADEFACRGIMYSKGGRLQEAIDDFTRAIELKRDSPTFYFNRAMSFRRMKDGSTQAIADLECVLRLRDKDDLHLLLACEYHRIDILFEMDRVDKAISFLNDQHKLLEILIEDLSWDELGFARCGGVNINALPFDGLFKGYLAFFSRFVGSIGDARMKADIKRIGSRFRLLSEQL